jgi:hypothetical protein
MSLALNSSSMFRIATSLPEPVRGSVELYGHRPSLTSLQDDDIDEINRLLSRDWWRQLDQEESSGVDDGGRNELAAVADMEDFDGLLDDGSVAAASELLPPVTPADVLSGWTVARLRQENLPRETVHLFARVMYHMRSEIQLISARLLLATRTPDELRAVCAVQGQEVPPDVASMTDDQALQLLNQFGPCGDKTSALSVYPPPEAPPLVHQAWMDATRYMTGLERLNAMAPFLAWIGSLNTVYDSAGQPLWCHAPGDPGYRNPYRDPAFSYREQVREMLERLQLFEDVLEEDIYGRHRWFLQRLYREFVRYGVA